MSVFKNNIFFLILIILVGLFGAKALFHSGFYTSHDGEHQVIRLYHFDRGLKDGQFPPRWAGTADNGYGYPLFIFSYQLPWFAGVPLLRVGFSLTDSIKGVFALGYIISGLLMFFWLKEMLGGLPALMGSVLYLWAPYRFSNIFVRASLGEATAFVFMPLLFWGIWKCQKKENLNKGIILTGLGLAGIILSHLMILVVSILPLFFWILLQLKESVNKKIFIKGVIIGVILGLSLSAYYFIPAIFEKQYTVATQTLQSHFLDHFVTLNQLIYSKWGYGFDFPGTVNDEMSFQIGIGQWSAVAGLVMLLIVNRLRKRKTDFLPLFSVLFFLFSIFMMLPVSKPIWEQITKFAYFDFPWRFLSLAVFSSSLAVALLVQHLKKTTGIFLAIFLILLVFYTNRNHLRVNQYIYNNDNYYINNLQTTNQFDEYRPKTLNHDYIKVKRERIEPDRGKITLTKQISRSNYLLLEGEAKQKGDINLNIAYYPGWRIWLNQKEQVNILGDNGQMKVEIPKGQFNLEAKFTNTPIRTMANSISFVGFLILAVLIVKRNRK